MSLITIDFETFYDAAFSLKKLTTEEYIRDERFEVIGVSVAVDDGEPEWFSGGLDETKEWFKKFDWENSLVCAHNTQFDGAILSWVFGIRPKGWLDTLCMARAIHGVDAGGSLKALAERYSIGTKGTEVENALGKRRTDFTPEQLARYGEYCSNDVALTRTLFMCMSEVFPKKELKVIDLTLRMFIEPKLELNLPLLEAHLESVKEKKAALLKAAESDRDTLMSNDKFAELLKQLNVDPPRKISARTGKEAWAFAKTDEEFKELLSHPDPRVQTLVGARLGVKTTLEETRTQRFIDIALRGTLPVPIKYYAAHTGRWGGADSINLQNLPSRGANAGKLKKAIEAPPGHVIIDCDSSQIEARTVAWLAGQYDLVQAFEKGEDVYKIMASSIYGKPIEEVNKEERFVGKTTILGCFGPDTKVLTDGGWKRIVEVKATDMLWDGEEWVTHEGVIPQGVKETITAYGVSATPDHAILTEHGWREWNAVLTDPSLFQSAIAKAPLPSLAGNGVTEGTTPLFGAIAAGKELLTATISRLGAVPDVTHALRKHLANTVKNIGVTLISSPTMTTGNGYLTASLRASHDATTHAQKHTLITGGAASTFMDRGAQTEARSYATSLRLKDGKTPSATLTASIILKDMNRVISASLRAVKTLVTSAPLVQCRQRLMTYDIAYAGPKNRYTIATDAGPIIVHNCGYGMGAAKFQTQLKVFGVDVPLDECQRIINVYRQSYAAIPELWKQAQRCLSAIITHNACQLGTGEIVKFDPTERGFLLPSGLWQRYEGLYKSEKLEGGTEYTYRTRSGPTKIYGGKVVENLCQGIARCVIAEQMIRIAKKYPVVLTVHDAVACIAPEAEAAQAQAYVEECMRWRPDWASDLPLNCESGIGKSYGDC